jgi:hypothetical protein
MDKTFGCAPFYFGGAIILLTVGGLFVYFGHPIIGTIIGIPGFILLGFALYTWALIAGIKNGDIPVVFRVDNPWENNIENPSHQKAISNNGRKKRTRKKL